MLSQTAEYALRAVIYLARQKPGESVAAELIADALGAPRNYLAKTLNTLAKRGIVASTRGPSGGFRLLEAPEELTVATIVKTFDEPRAGAICLLGGRPCNDAEPCEAHFRWKAVTSEMMAPLNNTTVAELLQDGQPDRAHAGEMAGTHRPDAMHAVEAITRG